MKRLTQNERERIILLTNNGQSLKCIARKLGLGKTTIYYHFRKIRGRTCRQVRLNFPSDEIKGEVFGLFAGDGCLTRTPRNYQYIIRVYCGIDQGYAEHVRELLLECFGKEFRVSGPPRNLRIETESKEIYQFFLSNLTFAPPDKAGTIQLKTTKLSTPFMHGFLRGFVDTDGHVNALKRRIVFYTTSKGLAMQTSEIAKELGFAHSIYISKRPGTKDLYHIRILSCSINKFLETIKPFKWVHGGLVDQR